MAGSIERRDLGLLGLAATCWGLGTVIAKAALDELPPITLLAIQLASSLAILAVWLRRQRGPQREVVPTRLARLGLLNPGLAYALSLLGLVTIGASVSVLLWVLEPILIAVLAATFLRERLTPSFAALSVVALTGVAVVLWDPAATSGEVVGVALTLAGVVCCAVYTVLTRRFLPGARETGAVVFAQQAHAFVLALALVGLVAVVGGAVWSGGITVVGLASAIASGALYYAGAYWCYLGALRRVPAAFASVSFYLIPVVGLVASAILLGEQLVPRQWLGAAIVLAAVALIAWNGRAGWVVAAPPVAAPDPRSRPEVAP